MDKDDRRGKFNLSRKPHPLPTPLVLKLKLNLALISPC